MYGIRFFVISITLLMLISVCFAWSQGSSVSNVSVNPGEVPVGFTGYLKVTVTMSEGSTPTEGGGQIYVGNVICQNGVERTAIATSLGLIVTTAGTRSLKARIWRDNGTYSEASSTGIMVSTVAYDAATYTSRYIPENPPDEAYWTEAVFTPVYSPSPTTSGIVEWHSAPGGQMGIGETYHMQGTQVNPTADYEATPMKIDLAFGIFDVKYISPDSESTLKCDIIPYE